MIFNLSNFYRSKEWEQLRSNLRLERIDSNGDVICEHCHKPIVNKYDCIAHHITHLTEANVNDYSISLNPDNIALVHHSCHNDIHNRFGSYTRHIYIVYGSPCSGKSTYVDEVALKDDLIIDIDRIYKAINNDRSNRLYANVMSIYRQLIDTVKTRNGQWINAYIVMANCNSVERTQKMLGAELIHIDTNKETCYKRAKEKNSDKGYLDYLDKYWREYEQFGKRLQSL